VQTQLFPSKGNPGEKEGAAFFVVPLFRQQS